MKFVEQTEWKWLPIRDLRPNPANSNKHSDEQIERLVKLIKYYGWRQPIIISNRSGLIAAGHARLLAAKAMGMSEVPVQYQNFEDDDEERGFLVSDNAIASWAELDLSLINTQLGDFDPGFDLDLLGIKDFTLDMSDKEFGSGEDEVPEAPPEPVVKRGELWVLGGHRLLIDDCTVKENVERLMAGEKADILVWDPPFNVGFEYDGAYKGQDAKSPEEYRAFLRLGLTAWESVCNPEHWAFVWQGMKNLRFFNDWFANYDWRLISVTKNFVQARPTWLNWATDPVVAWTTSEEKKNISHRDWFLANTANTAQTEDRIISGQHPCPRSIDVCEYFLSWSKSSHIALDLTLGSGTTLIACEKTNRPCFGMEIDPTYGQVIIERFQKFSGKKAVREDGVTFDSLKIE